jgi:hypothetical protein
MEVEQLRKALVWIDNHGNLVKAPFRDDEVANLFTAMKRRGFIKYRGKQFVLTEAGIREAMHSDGKQASE